jgi:hypothetical protein
LKRIAMRKFRQCQFTEDGNVELSGRDLPEHIGLQHKLFESWEQKPVEKLALAMVWLAMLLVRCGALFAATAAPGRTHGWNMDIGRINP